jgi:hypothetical protein
MRETGMKLIWCAAAIGLTAASAGAQTTINGNRRILGAWDASQATSTKAARQAASDPQTCAEGEIFYNTVRHVHRQCVGPNTWSDLAGGSGGGATPSGSTNAIQYNGGSGLSGVDVNATGTRKFLLQSGGGAPVLDVLQAGDVPARTATMYTPVAAAKCQAGVAVPNFNLPSSNAPTAACQSGTAYGAVLQFAAKTTQSFLEHFQLPADWSGAPNTIDLELAGRSADAAHSVNVTVQYACVGTSGGIDNLAFQSAGTASFVPNAGRNRTRTMLANLAAAGCGANDEYYFTVSIATDAAATAAYELISMRPAARRLF